jgi:hypothetical protein
LQGAGEDVPIYEMEKLRSFLRISGVVAETDRAEGLSPEVYVLIANIRINHYFIVPLDSENPAAEPAPIIEFKGVLRGLRRNYNKRAQHGYAGKNGGFSH